jgi:hypothetical protein
MKFPIPQNNLEREALNSITAKIRKEWGFAESFGPAGIMEKWQKFVRQVEDGYQLSIHDFTHELSLRDTLEEIKNAVPSRLGQEIEATLRPWDERFYSATRFSSKPIDFAADEGLAEWWFRIPLRAGAAIEGYLLAEGFYGTS